MTFRSVLSRVPAYLGAASALVLLGSLSACGGGSNSTVAPLPVVADAAGDLLSVQSIVLGNTYTNTSSVQKIRYRMKAVNGGLTEANAVLFIPKGTAPTGGWPLVVWAHGTTGVADACAPSRTVFAEDSDAIAPLLNAGYAVLAPDYEGLDAPGIHPYLIADSEANSVLHAVLAAQKIQQVSLSKKWAVIGHSQGGHAALATAQYAKEIEAQYPLVATVALAPGSDVSLITDIDFASIKELTASDQAPLAWGVAGNLNGYGTFLLHGATAIAPTLDLTKYVGDDLKPIIALAKDDRDCQQFGTALAMKVSSLAVAGQTPLDFKGIKSDWYLNPEIKALLPRTEVGKVKLSVPVYLAHGDADIDVPIGATRQLEATMRQLGTNVETKYVADLDHTDIVPNQMPAAIGFIKSKW
ncbi:alpha/beta fold hydrolase [Undibacterium cyanobacteriorum]|uniref:Alpha/beta fold hydrolase n=1 Tax=Undibacterium cyanobacteriorum TaxID=3073561 RepID=A0ABY9RFH7_9BURK|nr:alpha/beta fold hydrolase [Undibacterium sp. 20NA77.5]WMW79603.1 alpha/beta fold hydrolase [Undibacterium sp. 20NA77.5]